MLTTEELIRRLDAQHAEVTAHHTRTNDTLGELRTRVQDIEHRQARRGGGGSDANQTWGAQVVAHEAYRAFVGPASCKGRSGRIAVQAALTTSSSSAGALIAPDRRSDPAMIPRQRLTVRSLLAPGRTGSNLVEYPRQTEAPVAARVVSEGTAKPESSMAWELVQTPVRTIAHWIPASRQSIEDAPQLQSLVDSEMRHGLALAEEQEFLFGDGTGEHLHGLVPQAADYAPPFTIEMETMLDVLLLAIAQAQQSLVPATGIIVNDLDWKRMQAIKDGEGRYIGSGPFGSQPAVAWTLPVVDTPSMPEGEFLVGGFAFAAQVFDRLDPEILISDSHADFFIKNMLAILCEERVALATKRPSALVHGEYPSGT